MASPPATATATATETTSAVRLPPARVLLPFFVLLGYVAPLISASRTALGVLQPLPIYIYLSILLIFLQTAISENRSLARILYIFAASAFALIYAGEVVFDPSTGNFTRSPYTYIILNALLLAVFVYDTVDRRRPHRRGLDATIPAGARAQPGRLSPLSYGALGTDFAGMAILFFVAAFLLGLLGPQALLRFPRVQHRQLRDAGRGPPESLVERQGLDDPGPLHSAQQAEPRQFRHGHRDGGAGRGGCRGGDPGGGRGRARRADPAPHARHRTADRADAGGYAGVLPL